MGKNDVPKPSQFDRFVETARAIGCDEDKEKFEAQLGRIAAQKPFPSAAKFTKKPVASKKRRV